MIMSSTIYSSEELKRIMEQRQKSVPSKMFLNHFFAIQYHLLASEDRFRLKKVPYYNRLTLRNNKLNNDTVKKLLWNAWSTEMAYAISSQVNNSEYYKFALHWNFPQAYYSVYLAMTAFHETQGTATNVHEKSIKIFGNSIKDGHYPEAISFFCRGLYEDFEVLNLNKYDRSEIGFTGLSRIDSLEQAHQQIAMFLRTTRKQNAKDKKTRLEKGKKDVRFLTSKGTFTKRFLKSHWDIIYQTIPETSVLNILYRLRIKANYRDIEAFVNADINFKQFHDSLGEIVYYLNYVHEAYIWKAIGDESYAEILNDFLQTVGNMQAKERYDHFKAKN